VIASCSDEGAGLSPPATDGDDKFFCYNTDHPGCSADASCSAKAATRPRLCNCGAMLNGAPAVASAPLQLVSALALAATNHGWLAGGLLVLHAATPALAHNWANHATRYVGSLANVGEKRHAGSLLLAAACCCCCVCCVCCYRCCVLLTRLLQATLPARHQTCLTFK
jgi:hypothetical protein